MNYRNSLLPLSIQFRKLPLSIQFRKMTNQTDGGNNQACLCHCRANSLLCDVLREPISAPVCFSNRWNKCW